MNRNSRTTILCGAVAALFATAGLRAAVLVPAGPHPDGEFRAIKTADVAQQAPRASKDGGKDTPREKVAFLGVETGRVSATVAAQLGIPERAGLTVLRVIEESPAAGVLQRHDILTRFNDQILVNEAQLSVLVRAQRPGDEVTLTILRGGKEMKVRVTLGEHEVPRMAWLREGFQRPIDLDAFQSEFNEAAGEWGEKAREWAEKAKEMGSRVREDVEHTLRVLRSEDGSGDHVFFSEDGPVKRITRVNTDRGTVILEDAAGRVELRMTGGEKHLLVKDKSGTILFDGPISNDAQRAALGDDVRARLEKVESMEGVDFKWTDDADAEETSVLVPGPKGRGV